MSAAAARKEIHSVIVGGGPVGLATAIALAKRGFKSITVLEQAPAADHFEPTRAFTFALNPPSRHALSNIGVKDLESTGLKFENIKVLRVEHSDKVKVSHFPPKGFFGAQLPRIMLMRQELNEMLATHIAHHHADAIKVRQVEACQQLQSAQFADCICHMLCPCSCNRRSLCHNVIRALMTTFD